MPERLKKPLLSDRVSEGNIMMVKLGCIRIGVEIMTRPRGGIFREIQLDLMVE